MSATGSPLLETFNQRLAREVGISLAPERLIHLSDRLQQLWADGGMDWFRNARWPQEQTRKIARLLAVSETYFLRDSRVFQAIRQEVLPRLVAAGRNRGRQLSIWSAGCASGEEVYSLAILLHELLPDLASWKITLRGTDINPDAIERARAATYGAWSFRESPAGFREAYFEKAPDGQWKLKSQYHAMVKIEEGNLLYPAPSELAAAPFDLILCRNVLIYFDARQGMALLRRMAGMLRDDGCLMVGLSELHLAEQAGLRMRAGAGTYCFTGAVEPPDVAGMAEPVADVGGSIGNGEAAEPASAAQAAGEGERTDREEEAASPAAGFQMLLSDAAECAARRHFASAREWAEAAVALEPVNPAGHLMLGMIQEELGLWEEARQALRRALFLDERCALAWFHLGLLSLRDGETRQARHFLRQALALAGQSCGVACAPPGSPSPTELQAMIWAALGRADG